MPKIKKINDIRNYEYWNELFCSKYMMPYTSASVIMLNESHGIDSLFYEMVIVYMSHIYNIECRDGLFSSRVDINESLVACYNSLSSLGWSLSSRSREKQSLCRRKIEKLRTLRNLSGAKLSNAQKDFIQSWNQANTELWKI